MSKSIHKILIVEDEALIADQLALFLESANYQVIAIVDEAKEAIGVLKENAVDLVFLDINLNDALDGVDIAHKINADFKIPFIYLSSNTDPQTLKRMSLTQPISFITKPFQKESVLAAVEIAKERVEAQPIVQEESIFVKNSHVWEKIEIKDILYIEAQDNYISIHLKEERKMILMTMKTIQEQLDPSCFIRVHRSFIVNKEYIDTIGPNFIKISDEEIPLSASGKEELLQKIKRLK